MTEKEGENAATAFKAKFDGDFGAMIDETKKMFSQRSNWFKKYKFMSVALAFSGSGRSQYASSVDLPCETVFILMKNGEGYFISPLDIAGFMNEAKKHLA